MPRLNLHIFTPVTVAAAITSHGTAAVSWDYASRSASAVIAPNLASDSAVSNQVLGIWHATAASFGPWIPDPIAEQAVASATHFSNIGEGAVPWAILTGRVVANHAIPSPANFGIGTATIQLVATFTTTESVDYEIRSLIGSFQPEASIRAKLVRGLDTIFDISGPATFERAGTLAAGEYTILMMASYSDGDPGTSGIGCDLRFTLPTPAAGALGLACALMRRRRNN